MTRINLTLVRGDTWTQSILRLGDISTADEIWLTAKRDLDNSDALADIKVSSVAGLEVINQGAPTAAGNASITVNNAIQGNITVVIEAVETAKLDWSIGRFRYDVQWKDTPTGRVVTPRRGYIDLIADSTLET